MIPTPHLDDDGLSAVLDGQGDPGETEHARDCVECQDRLAQWDAARKLVGAPVSPAPEEVRRAAIAAATAAARNQRAPVPFRQRIPLARAVAGIAAALVVAGVSYAAVHNTRGSAAKASSAGALTPGSTVASSNGAGTNAPSGSRSGTVNVPSAALPASSSLGSFTSTPPLVAALKQQLTPAYKASAGSAPLPPACSAKAAAAAGNPRGGPILAATATYAGTAAEVYVYPRPGGDRALVLRASDCAVLATANF